MINTLIAKTADPSSAVREDERPDSRPGSHDPEDRLHVSALLMGLVESRAGHIDFFDTAGGAELARWYRRHKPRRGRGGR